MKIFIPIMFSLTLVLAEPPVDDGYPARSSHDDHRDYPATDHQSPSQEYGLPSDSFAARNAHIDGYEYNALNAKSSTNSRGQLQNHAPPKVRISFNQRFGSIARNSPSGYTTMNAKSFSEKDAAPSTRNGISQEYGVPDAKSLSQEYGVPTVIVSARTQSRAKSTLSQEYDVPAEVGRSNQRSHSTASNFRNSQSGNHLNPEHSASAPRSELQSNSLFHSYMAPSARSNIAHEKKQSAKSGLPIYPVSYSNGALSSRSQSLSHDDFSAESVGSHSYDRQKNPSKTIGTPNARSLSQENGLLSSRTNLMTSAMPSSYAPARSSPSSTYLPSARTSAPEEQYGVPEQRDGAKEGYDNARARALEELRNQEPASYDFGYQIEDQESGSDFGHSEGREGNSVRGSYFVVLPDGTKQTVEYEADERGFRPRISVEAAASGTDEDVAGPY